MKTSITVLRPAGADDLLQQSLTDQGVEGLLVAVSALESKHAEATAHVLAVEKRLREGALDAIAAGDQERIAKLKGDLTAARQYEELVAAGLADVRSRLARAQAGEERAKRLAMWSEVRGKLGECDALAVEMEAHVGSLFAAVGRYIRLHAEVEALVPVTERTRRHMDDSVSAFWSRPQVLGTLRGFLNMQDAWNFDTDRRGNPVTMPAPQGYLVREAERVHALFLQAGDELEQPL